MYRTEQDAREAVVSKAQAIAEINRHRCNIAEFLVEVGDKTSYTGEEVLNWLGY